MFHGNGPLRCKNFVLLLIDASTSTLFGAAGFIMVLSGNILLAVVLLVLAFPLQILGSSDTWVVIVATSRYWFNYRHTANGALVYRAARTLGVPDNRIIFMNALDILDDSRNSNPGYVHFDAGYAEETWPSSEFDIDYTQEEVSGQSFLNMLTGRSYPIFNGRDQLNTNANSTILIYLAGHGGDEFFKFHDYEEMSAQDLALAFQEMHAKKRYKEILLILDTCQAVTMANYITAPNIITLASSLRGENSYAYPTVDSLGVAIADRFTHTLYSYLLANMVRGKNIISSKPQLKQRLSLHNLHAAFNWQMLHSTATIVSSPNSRDAKDIMLADYFSGPTEEPKAVNVTPIVSRSSVDEDERIRREKVVALLLS